MTENIHKHRILILDFGSQYTQLVARRREMGLSEPSWSVSHPSNTNDNGWGGN